MNRLYCVHLSAINPNTGERNRLVLNDVPAMTEDAARVAAIESVLRANPETKGIEFVRAARTDVGA